MDHEQGSDMSRLKVPALRPVNMRTSNGPATADTLHEQVLCGADLSDLQVIAPMQLTCN